MKYPVSKPDLNGNELHYIKEAVAGGWISSKGVFVELFEEAWAKKNNRKYGVACSSGTTALVLALRALGIKKGDEVLVPEFTMVATAWAVTYVGATPVFVDCNSSLNMDYTKIEGLINKKTKAIIPVAIYGRMVNKNVFRIARKHNLKIIEDLAEAHGTRIRGDIACYSLFANKIITSGEGGICLTNNKEYAELMKWYGSMCFNEDHTFIHPDIGYNFRMTSMQGAIALAQVERIDKILAKRQQIADWYDKYLTLKVIRPKRNVVWMYDIDVRGYQREIVEFLKKEGIETRVFFKPMSQQPMYNGDYTNLVAFNWAYRGIYLPTYTELEEEDVKFISEKVNEFYEDK